MEVRGKTPEIISTGQRATFGLTLALARPHRKDGGRRWPFGQIFDSGRGRFMTFPSSRRGSESDVAVTMIIRI